MFVNVRMEESDKPARELPFGDVVYMMAALLDPSYCLFWLEHDVLVPEDVKSELEEVVMGRFTFYKLTFPIHLTITI